MTSVASHIANAQKDMPLPNSAGNAGMRKSPDIPAGEWWRATLFLLSMALMGLKFPLGYLLVPLCLLSSWYKNRYHFAIQLTFFMGAYSLIGEDTLPVKTEDLALLLGFVGAFVYRKPRIVRTAFLMLMAYAAVLLVLARFSDESMMIQLRTLRYWLGFVYFLVPLMIFAGKPFSINRFWESLMPYVLVMCAFYTLDAFVFNGHILVPNSYMGAERVSTWNKLITYGFGTFPRKYPPGLYWLIMIVLPLARKYKLPWWQWLLILTALMAARTFTLIMAFALTLMAFQAKPGRLIGYAMTATILLATGYAVDSTLPKNPYNDESMLRVKSSIDQFINLGSAQDDEDAAEMGSGRIGQAIPKFELMYAYNKQWTGIGFLHPQLTTNTKYIIVNEFYSDIEKSEEVATGIEVIPLQVFLTVGYIGIVAHFAFFLGLYFLVRRLRHSIYFLSVLTGTFLLGIGGFSGWISGPGLFLNALAFSAVLLANRRTVWGKDAPANPEDTTPGQITENVQQ